MAGLSIREQHVYPEICIVEDHAVKCHAVGSLLNASELQKSVVLALQLNRLPVAKEGGSFNLRNQGPS